MESKILQMIVAEERYLRARIFELEAEVEHWKKLYDDSVYQSIQHSHAMMGQVIVALTKDLRQPPAPPPNTSIKKGVG